MTDSKIVQKDGEIRLVVGGREITPFAYVAYFEERAQYADFAGAGCRLFSVNAHFSSLPINAGTGFAPFHGIFDKEGEPDFSVFDADIRRVLSACPDAYIFPRVGISMPAWWIEKHPDQCCEREKGVKREALFSPEFRKEGERMLRAFIAHVQASDYADSIIGYQISGGNTQEWFHFDLNGSLSPISLHCFEKYLKQNGGAEASAAIPAADACAGEGLITDPAALQYLAFVNESVAETVGYFARIVKACTGRRQIVGTFYGYVEEVPSALWGTHALAKLLDDPDIDFFCSPASYAGQRSPGVDWAEMSAGASIRAHGKMYFLENDIRTFLSDFPENSRPGSDPERKYSGAVWKGPPTEKESVWAIRKAFGRQLTQGNGMWWFDMWGGWYASDALMAEMKEFLKLQSLSVPESRREVALFFDETYASRVGTADTAYKRQKSVKVAMGNTGIPFDAVLTSDAPLCRNYKAAVLPYPEKYASRAAREVCRLCGENGIPVLFCDDEPTPDSLRARLCACGVHCFEETGDVIYYGRGLLVIHAAHGGAKTIRLPEKMTVVRPDGAVLTDTERIGVTMQPFETLFFRIIR